MKQIDSDGSFVYSNEVEVTVEIPKQVKLSQNYPNPFNPSTTVKYSIPNVGNENFRSVQLVVYDVLGSKVATLVNEKQKPGNYEVVWDAKDYSSGVYFYLLKAGDYLEAKKMILLR